MTLPNEQDAITQALDVGFTLSLLPVNSLLTDPAFWQALGKARGWDEKAVTKSRTDWELRPYWMYQALRCFEQS